MAELKLGTKFACFRCTTKFYDLGKSDPVCPKCGADQREAAKSEPGAATPSVRKKRKAEVVRAVEDEETVEVEQVEEVELPEAELDAVIDDEEAEEAVEEEE